MIWSSMSLMYDLFSEEKDFLLGCDIWSNIFFKCSSPFPVKIRWEKAVKSSNYHWEYRP